MVKKKRPHEKKTVIRVRRRCYLVENLKKIRLCRKCNESLEKSAGFGRRCPRCNVYYVEKNTYAGYYSLLDLENSVYLFPLEYKVSKEAILMDERFMTGTFGGELSISLKG